MLLAFAAKPQLFVGRNLPFFANRLYAGQEITERCYFVLRHSSSAHCDLNELQLFDFQMKECIATIDAIQPTDERRDREKFDVGGGMTLELIDVTFRLEHEAEDMTPVTFKEPYKVWGVSSETGRLWQNAGAQSDPYQLNGGTFVVTLNRHSGLAIGKKFTVLLPGDSK